MNSTKQARFAGLAFFLGFIACIPLANWMIGNVGVVCVPQGPCLVPVWPWGPGGKPLMAPSGVLMIGLALVLRDLVQRRLGRGVAVGAIVAGAALSGAVAPTQLLSPRRRPSSCPNSRTSRSIRRCSRAASCWPCWPAASSA